MAVKTINRTTAAEFIMRLLILGATGGTGRQLTSQAVEHGRARVRKRTGA